MKQYLYFLILLSGFSNALNAATITFDTNPISVAPGEIFTLDIIGTGFLGTEGGGAEFLFDASLLQVNSISIDETVWDFFADTGTIDNITGNVSGIAVAAFNDPGFDFIVASIEFLALGVTGSTDLVLSENALNPWASLGSQINPMLVDGSVSVTAVPLPSAFILLIFPLMSILSRKTNI